MINKKLTLAASVFIFVFGVYLYSSVPVITQDDSGELAGAGATLGTAHPPGYPLYCIFSKALVSAFPLGNKSYRVNLASSLGIAAAGTVIALAAFEVSASLVAAAVIGFAFSFSSYIWAMANVTEVYGIAAVLTALMWFLMLKVGTEGGFTGVRYFYAVMFLFGAAFTCHYTIGLLVPGILCWMVFNKDHLFSEAWKIDVIKGFGWSLVGVSSVLYILIRANQNPLFGWEDPKTLERFWQVIARLRYGTASLAQGGPPIFSPEIVFGKLSFYFSELYGNFSWLGTILFAVGVYRYFKEKRLGWTLFALIIGSGPGFVLLANVGLDQGSKELMERFFFLSFMFAAAIMAGGIAIMPKFLKGVSLALPLMLLWQNAPALSQRQEYLYYDYGKNILKTLPPNSLLFSDRADEMEFAVAYLHIAAGLRPDIKYIDCNAGATRSAYGDRYYRIWGKPRLAIRERIEREMISNHSGSVYYATFDPKMINIPRFREGLLFRAKPAGVISPVFPCGEVYTLRIPDKNIEGRLESLVMSYYNLLGEYSMNVADIENTKFYFSGVSAYDRKGVWNMSLGFAFHEKGFKDEALACYNKAVARGVATGEIYTNIGTILETKGLRNEAVKNYMKALSITPRNAQTHFNLAVIYWKESRWDEVIRELRNVLDIEPSNESAQRYLAAALARAGK